MRATIRRGLWGLRHAGGRTTMRFVLAAVVIAASGVAAPGDVARQVLERGHVTVVVEPRRPGMRILCDGIEVTKHSEMVVTKPPWAPHYYVGPHAGVVRQAERFREGNAIGLRLLHRSPQGAFQGTESLTVQPDGSVVQRFEGRFSKPDAEALIQWRMGALNPVLIIGRAYRAKLRDGREVAGTVPVMARGGELEDTALARGFEVIEFDSRIGPLRIEVESSEDLIVYDFRKDRWANPDDPYFWFGDLGSRIRADHSVAYTVTYHLPPPMEAAGEGDVLTGQAKIERRPDAQTYPHVHPPRIIPRPKEAAWGDGVVTLWSRVLARTDAQLGLWWEDVPEAESAVGLLRRSLRAQFGVECRSHGGDAGASVRFEKAAGNGLPAEGYELCVEPDARVVRLRANDAAGFRHAVQTLAQMVTVRPNEDVVAPAATIRDWPSLKFRGVHLFTGGQGPALHEKLLRRVIAALKMNHLVLEAEYIEWASHPEIHHPEYGMPKDDVRHLLDVCTEVGIEVTPLVMSLGHCQWIFETGHHLDLAEDPEAKWAYCVTNPDTYDFIFEIYAEALELFKPRWFHIGHDEFADRGRVPFRESSKPYTVEQLFMMDTLKLHQWFAERGVRVMMWGDMMLAKGEAPDACHAASPESAAKLRAELPDDIIVTDWHYAGNPPADFTSLKIFQEAGNEVIAATWYRPINIVHFAQAAHQQDALGLLQTTWAGYSLDPQSFAREMHQYAAYVLAAEAAWNADNPPAYDEYPASSHFIDLMGLSTLQPANRSGWTADLSAIANQSLTAQEANDWFGLGPQHDLSAIDGGAERLGGVAFALAKKDGRPAGLALRGKLAPNLPAAAKIELGASAAQLVFLHTTSFACDKGARVGSYKIEYVDGQTATVDVVYGENVMAYTDVNAAPAAPLVWRGKTPVGAAVALRALVWQNPRPDTEIRRLVAHGGDAAGTLVLLAVTGLNDTH